MAKRRRKGVPVVIEPETLPVLTPRFYLYDNRPNPEAIKFYRSQHDLTQVGLAKLLSVSVDSVRRWERGQASPRLQSSNRLHQFVVATIRLLQRYDGIIPPSKRFRRFIEDDDGLKFSMLLELLADKEFVEASSLADKVDADVKSE